MLLSQQGTFPPAILALADGTVFIGNSIGATGSTTGEVVFNTAMTGYQEILTDPSYCQQIVTLTYPHIGNYGVNEEDVEADKVHAAGLIIRDLPLIASNFRTSQTLSQYLRRQGTVAIANIDTRKLTRLLRSKGAQNGCIVGLAAGEEVTPARIDKAVAAARKRAEHGRPRPGEGGVGRPALRLDPERMAPGVRLRRAEVAQVPRGRARLRREEEHPAHAGRARLQGHRGAGQTSASEVKKLKPDGVFLSNGPGDPEPCDYAIEATRELIEAGYPTFGICLGHQIMALASGAKTFKMKFGHHGANHPVKDLDTGRVSITSQNHGFAVDEKTLPANLRATHVSLFDGTLQGLARTDKPAFCFQGHPEASPGPHDIGYLFDRFTGLMDQAGDKK